MRLFRTPAGFVVENEGKWYSSERAADWDLLITRDDLYSFLGDALPAMKPLQAAPSHVAAPIGNQEVWAAGVTYFRSRDARMEESKSAGGGDFYDRVYGAERPELFFKATAHRVVGPEGKVAIRDDAHWSVPEPELALLVSPRGKITGYTIGNDMSSRDIEGENPLYLPQAKVYDRSCSLGPSILAREQPLEKSTEIRLHILRNGTTQFEGSTNLEAMKRDPESLVQFLFRNNSFPNGCFLLTGTGIVPPDSFNLKPGDEIRITISGIGTLTNFVG
ncbi:MAG: fumarylacetoacetate hydrolase family protein [Acidobacteriaceae bacterium]|nr:fumarylacetoacetate hydrolase family protein [Acidobacteriaceae bacterium]